MTKENNSILLNLNRFGPRFTSSDFKLLLSKPQIKDIDEQKKLWLIHPFEEFIGKNFEEIKINEIKRYNEITDENTHLSITPSQNYEQVTSRIIQPIVLGKKYFALGEYVPCIAMSGLAAEMMTLVYWDMSEFSIAGKKLEKNEQKILFGKINQERKIKILHLIKMIQDADQVMLEEIRNIRNKYTHSWDIKNSQDKGNAKKTIRYALILFKKISGIDLYIDNKGDQKLKVDPKFLKFLKKQKILS